jgi:SNF2 family DNA or RNA helicase
MRPCPLLGIVMPSNTPPLSANLSDMPNIDLAVLRVLALYRRDMGQVRLVDLLSSYIFKPQHVRAAKLTAPMVKESLNSLHKKQLIERLNQGTYKLVASKEAAVLWDLVQSGDLNSFKALRSELLRYEHSNWQHDELFYRREVFWAALLGDAEACDRWSQNLGGGQSKSQHPSLASLLLCDDDGKYLFENLRTDVQAALLKHEFTCAERWLSGCMLCYEYAVAHAREFKSFPLCLGFLCSQARLRADWQALESVHLLMLPQHELFDHAARALMKGDFVLANQFYNEVIKLERGTSAKRKIFIPELEGILYALAAIGENTAASFKMAKVQVDDGFKQREDLAYVALKPFVDSLVSGMPFEAQPTYYAPRLPLNMGGIIEVMVLFWRESPFQKMLKDILISELERLTSFGYHWVAAELDVLLVRIFNEPPKYLHWHEQQQLKPLIDIRAHEEPWKRALTALASLSKPTSTSVSAANLYRIAWLIESSDRELRLEAREQKCSAKGVWNKGRIVSLKRLITEPENVAGLSEQDKRIIKCIDRNRSYYGSEYEMDIEQALPFLINHPAVFWSAASDIRIDVIAGEITLQMNERAGQIRLQLDPKISPDQSVMWKKMTPTRLAVYVNTPEIKQIAGILGAGLSVPSEAKIQLVEVIKAIAPHITIHSNLPELSAHMATLNADTTLYAHLLPLKEGLRMQLLQRPLPNGSWYTPGLGPTNVVGEVAGEAVQAARNLKDEKKRLNKLIDACPSLALLDRVGSDQEWHLEHPEICLELLSELKAQPETVVQLVWPEGERMRLSGSRSLNQMRLNIRKQGEWFEADGDITLDDGRVLALRELLQMISSTSGRFLKLGDNDYIALTESFRRRLEELNAFTETNTKGRLRINPLAAPALAELAREVGNVEADDAWKEQVKKLDALADFTPKLPPTLQAELRDYQLEGYHWLARLAHWGVGACLADDMGLGKTVQTLALLLDRALKGPALVVAPLSVAMNWLSEAQKFSPTLNMRSYHNNRDLTELGAFDVVVASYGMLQQDAELFAQQHWHTVVLDEAQAIKNTATKRSQAAMSLTADFKMIASGTPVENHLGELWNLFRFINPGLLGSKDRFAQRFATPIERGDIPARAHLKKLIQPFILRRTKTQVLNELPSRTQITLQVELSDAERHLYEALRQQAVSNVENAGKAAPMQVLAEITKLRRFCCNPKLVLKDTEISASKLTVFAETLDELLDNKHKALVFSQFVDHLTIVRHYLDSKAISYQYLDGSVPALERKKRVDAFQSGEGDVFLISLKAGGTGLNLTAADYVIHLDPWWNPAVEDQASDRAHRMGQLRPVTIYRLVVKDTIEEKIIGLHGKKRDLADSLLDGGEAAGRLDTAALLGLLKESV